jgi:hypothetical protein
MRAAAMVVSMVQRSQAIEDAKRAGFDLSLVDESLRLTHEERARQHDQALVLVLELDQLRRDRNHAKSESTASTTG